MESLWLQICDIQGRLFKLAWKAGYDSEDFMKQFMRSRVARDLDSEYNRMQWAGEEYLLEEFADECPQTIKGNVMHSISPPTKFCMASSVLSSSISFGSSIGRSARILIRSSFIVRLQIKTGQSTRTVLQK